MSIQVQGPGSRTKVQDQDQVNTTTSPMSLRYNCKSFFSSLCSVICLHVSLIGELVNIMNLQFTFSFFFFLVLSGRGYRVGRVGHTLLSIEWCTASLYTSIIWCVLVFGYVLYHFPRYMSYDKPYSCIWVLVYHLAHIYHATSYVHQHPRKLYGGGSLWIPLCRAVALRTAASQTCSRILNPKKNQKLEFQCYKYG